MLQGGEYKHSDKTVYKGGADLNYLLDLTDEELKYICSVIPVQEAIGYFSRYPKEFAKIKPGFRAKSLNHAAVIKTLYDNRNRDFIASFLKKHIDAWVKDINDEINKDLKEGLSIEEAYVDVLSQSFFAENVPLFFKIDGIEKEAAYLSGLSPAVSFLSSYRRKVSSELETLQRVTQELETKAKVLEEKLANEEKHSKELTESEANLKKDLEEANRRLQIDQDTIKQLSDEIEELQKELEKTKEDEIWKTEEMEQKIESLSAQLAALMDKNAEYEVTISKYETQIAASEEEINTWRNQLRNREIQLFNYKAERATLLNERETDREKIKALKDALEAESIKQKEQKTTETVKEPETTDIKASSLSIVSDHAVPLCPVDMEAFEELFTYNLENIGLVSNDEEAGLLVSYLEKNLFDGIPIVAKRGPGINIANCLANTLYGVPFATMLSYSEGAGVQNIIDFISSTPDRVICIDGFIGNCNEQELIPALEKYRNKIIILTYMFDRTLRYVPYELLSYVHYISVDEFPPFLRVKTLKESPSEISEKQVVHKSGIDIDKRAQKIFKEIAGECGLSNDIACAMSESIESEKHLNEMLMFTLLPYVSKILGKSPYNCSKRLQRYAGEAGRCPYKETIMRWFG